MNYYNEIDPHAAAWIRELIRKKLIPVGDVDTRSITEIKPDELKQYTQCHFFAGIAGWPLALELASWPTTRNVWTGSCPCQPFSSAGNQLGDSDERHLWPALFNLIRECRPECVFGEQVANAIGKGWLDGVSSDLEGAGYACGAAVLGAHSVGAPHIRQRLYWVAQKNLNEWQRVVHADECIYEKWDEDHEQPICPVCAGEYGGWGVGKDCQCPGPTEDGFEFEERDGVAYARRVGNAEQSGLERHSGPENARIEPGRLSASSDRPSTETGVSNHWDDHETAYFTGGETRRVQRGTLPLADGVSSRMVKLRGYGNAIVPQVAAEFVRAYLG
jgi:DNA (cytosine-5)-methyltransferase 1